MKAYKSTKNDRCLLFKMVTKDLQLKSKNCISTQNEMKKNILLPFFISLITVCILLIYSKKRFVDLEVFLKVLCLEDVIVFSSYSSSNPKKSSDSLSSSSNCNVALLT